MISLFVAFLAGLLALGIRRPFLFVLAYVYVDTVSPQRLSYFLLNSIPLSLIIALLAMGGWAIADRKDELRFSAAPGAAARPARLCRRDDALCRFPGRRAGEMGSGRGRRSSSPSSCPSPCARGSGSRRYLLFLTLSAASIIIVGGIKTALGGGGYGVLNLMVDNNSGLYESSTISTVAIALIPIILWLARFGTIFTPDWRVKPSRAG